MIGAIAATYAGITPRGCSGQKKRAHFCETVCPWCGEKFGYYPSTHLYRRKGRAARLYFDKPSCMRAWDEEHKSNLNRHIDNLKKRLIYLELQGKLPPNEREVQGDIWAMIERTEAQISTAMAKKATRDGLL